MAKLRVGDIEIDGDRISIGGHQMTGEMTGPATRPSSSSSVMVVTSPAPPRALVPAPAQVGAGGHSLDGLAGLEKLPVKGTTLIGGGAIGMAAGSLLLLFASAPHDLISFAFHGGLLVTAGAGVAGLGALKQLAMSRARARETAQAEAELGPLIDQLRGLLHEPHKTQTVEWIAGALGAGEAKAVRALAHMRRTGELREDLNVDSGEYFYYLEAPEPARLRGLDDRLADLERSNGK